MLNITNIEKSIAVEIDGININSSMNEQLFKEIDTLYDRYPVLVFKNQKLTPNNQQTFASHFGTLKPRIRDEIFGTVNKETPFLMFVTNIKDDGTLTEDYINNLDLHSDSAFAELPARTTFMHCIETPDTGGDTVFVDMLKVYERLPQDIKDYIYDKTAINIHLPNVPLHPNLTQEERIANAKKATHPLVIKDPTTGNPVLFANRHQTFRINYVSEEESKLYLDKIFNFIDEQTDLYYYHKWSVGDLVLWDNQRTLHGRTPYDSTKRRLMRRFVATLNKSPEPYYFQKLLYT